MNGIIDFANKFFKPILDMGAPIIMLIVLTLLALLFGVKFSKALEGGIKLAIALTGIGAIIGMLNTAFSASLAKFVENTGIQLNITDVGWAPLATITWGGWIFPFFLYQKMKASRERAIAPKIEEQHETIYGICKSGSELLHASR